MSVDVHNHVMPRQVLDLLARDPRYQVVLEDGCFESPNISRFKVHAAWYDPDAKLREMDRMNLDAAVISVAPKPLYFYEHPLELQAAAARACNQGMVPPIVGGASTPISGNSSAMCSAPSPTRSSTDMRRPSGVGIRLISSAPKASR